MQKMLEKEFFLDLEDFPNSEQFNGSGRTRDA